MLTAFWLLVKEKLFTSTGIFLLIFLGIFSVFLFSNSNVILSKFGFETTTTLKAELVKSQKELEKATEMNAKLNETIKKQDIENKHTVAMLSESYKELDKYKSKATDIKKIKEVRDVPLVKKIIEKTTTTETTMTIPLEEYNKLSESNIVSLNDTYSSLFETSKSTT